MTAGTGAGTFGTIVELDASVEYDAVGFWVHMIGASTNRRELRLYVGAASSEVEICTLPGPTGSTTASHIYVPIALPAGSRLSASSACSNATGQVMYAHVTLVRGRSYDPVCSYGDVIGYTSGDVPDVDAGATANTKGSYVELTASTLRDAKGFSVMLMSDPSIDTTNQTLFDIAVGGIGSEQIIAADLFALFESFRSHHICYGPFWTPIPAGSRVAARCQSSTNAAAARIPKVGVILWE